MNRLKKIQLGISKLFYGFYDYYSTAVRPFGNERSYVILISEPQGIVETTCVFQIYVNPELHLKINQRNISLAIQKFTISTNHIKYTVS